MFIPDPDFPPSRIPDPDPVVKKNKKAPGSGSATLSSWFQGNGRENEIIKQTWGYRYGIGTI
jgi:hypothetical protein